MDFGISKCYNEKNFFSLGVRKHVLDIVYMIMTMYNLFMSNNCILLTGIVHASHPIILSKRSITRLHYLSTK